MVCLKKIKMWFASKKKKKQDALFRKEKKIALQWYLCWLIFFFCQCAGELAVHLCIKRGEKL